MRFLQTVFTAKRLLPMSALVCCAALIGQQPRKTIKSIQDIELGMPHDYVLAKLAEIYKIDKKNGFEAPTEMWNVLSGNQYVGQLVFKVGKLDSVEVRLYAGREASELFERLFTAIYENSGKSTIKEEPACDLMTRTRAAIAEMEARELTVGKAKYRLWFFRVGERQFRLISTFDGDDRPSVDLSELIIKKWQPGPTERGLPK